MVLPISLIDLPQVALNAVLEKCEYPSTQILRKTCWDLRNFIDESRSTSLMKLSVKLNTKSIDFEIHPRCEFNNKYPLGKEIQILYFQTKKGCLMTWMRSDGAKRKLLENVNFVDAFLIDFHIALRNSKNVLEMFQFSTNQLMSEQTDDKEFIKTFKKSITSKIKTKNVDFAIDNQEQLMKLLPMVSSKILEKITISAMRSWSYPLCLNKVSELDQWRNVKVLTMNAYTDESTFQYYHYFDRVNAWLKNVTPETMLTLKTIFLNSTSHKNFEIAVFPDHEVAVFVLGQGFTDETKFRNWYFRSLLTNKIVKIQIDENLILRHIEESDVPLNVIMKCE